MNEEYNSLIEQGTWILTSLPPNRRAIKCKWVFKKKYNTKGEIERYKARLVAKGFSQRDGIDYTETFSPVVRLDSIRLLLALVAKLDLEMVHFVVKTAFLYGHLEETIYMEQPQGYEKNPRLACLLKKSLYGLKQASRQWNLCFTNFLKRFNLRPLVKDNCIFTRTSNNQDILIIALYVDDVLICCNNMRLISSVVSNLRSQFQIKLMDPRCFVGLEIFRNREKRGLFNNQEMYATKIIERFNIVNAKHVSTPFDYNQRLCATGTTDGTVQPVIQVPYRQVIGSLMYLMIGSRPDIAYAVGVIGRYAEQPRLAHWNACMRVLRYINSTKSYGIRYQDSLSRVGEIKCFSDSDYAADVDTRKSITGFTVFYHGGPISWKSTKQTTVATSTCEAEFVAASVACKDTLWAQQLLTELQVNPECFNMYIDNQGAIKVITNQQLHSKTKHIDIHLMFIRELSESKKFIANYIPTSKQLADIFTKPLARDRFSSLRSQLGIVTIK